MCVLPRNLLIQATFTIVHNSSDANLVWDYTDSQNNIQYIIYSVLVDGTFVRMMVNDSRGV